MVSAVLVGCGSMSKVWLDAARQIDDLVITGLVDIEIERAQARAAEFGLHRVAVGDDLRAILAQTRPDVVLDAVVPSARRDVAMAAFDHGCHLLTEKPLAASHQDALGILAAARRAGRIHAVVQNRRYLASVRRMRRFIDSGAIGRPTSIHCDFFIAPHFGGFREEMDHVLLVDMSIHTFDAARYIVNGIPRSVYCEEWEPANSWYRRGSSAAAIFDFGDGIVFTYRGSWCADGLRTSWESSWRVVGELGSLCWDGFDDIRAEAKVAGREGLFDAVESVAVPPLDSGDRVGGHLGVMLDFIEGVRNGTEPETSGTDNIKSLAMVFGAAKSADTGRRVAIDI
jgi:predicted dehydrogenase